MTTAPAPITRTTKWEAPANEADNSRYYWRKQAILRQKIIDKQDKTIADLTASVVQLENDYDAVEAQLKQAEDRIQKLRRKPEQRVMIL